MQTYLATSKMPSEKKEITESRHVKIDHLDALESKKQILLGEISILNAIRRLRNYRTLRKKEMDIKKELKSDFDYIRNKIKLIVSSLPEESQSWTKKENEWNIDEPRDLMRELDDIKRQLERLQN